MDKLTAGKIWKAMKAGLAEIREYRQADLSEFPRLDHKFYERLTREFENNGFTHIGDKEDLTGSQQNKSFRTCIRTFIGDGGKIQGAIFHLKPSGFIWFLQLIGLVPREMKTIDLESEVEDGHFIVTTSAKTGHQLSSPPQVHVSWQAGATLAELLAAHREALAQYLSSHPAAQIRLISDSVDAGKSQARLDLIKSTYRKSVGILSKEELATFGEAISEKSLKEFLDSNEGKP